jgi:hypothetical protein
VNEPVTVKLGDAAAETIAEYERLIDAAPMEEKVMKPEYDPTAVVDAVRI